MVADQSNIFASNTIQYASLFLFLICVQLGPESLFLLLEVQTEEGLCLTAGLPEHLNKMQLHPSIKTAITPMSFEQIEQDAAF